jgi:hypothetical protein
MGTLCAESGTDHGGGERSWATIVIKGTGFGDAMSGLGYLDSGITVYTDAGLCQINSWSNTEIIISCNHECLAASMVYVDAVYGTASAPMDNILANTCLPCHTVDVMSLGSCGKVWDRHLQRGALDRNIFEAVETALDLDCDPASLPPKDGRTKY